MQRLIHTRALHLLLFSAVFMTAACDDGINSQTPAGPVTPPSMLAFHLCVQPDEVTDIDSLRARLDIEVEINNEDEMIWLPLRDSADWIDSDEDRQLMASNPDAFFTSRRMVGTLHGGSYFLLLWNTSDKSLGPHHEGWTVVTASRTPDQFGKQAVSFILNAAGGNYMEQLTANHAARALAFTVNGKVLSAPIIQTTISRNVIVTGGPSGLTETEASELVRQLNVASLVPREPAGQ